jgi:hypothetical protein
LRRINTALSASFLLCLLTSLAPAQEEAPPSVVFHTKTQLVLVDVVAQNSKTGMPLTTLTKDDFRLFDNQHEVSMTTFDSGAHYDTRPVALWLIVICNEGNKGRHGELGSGSFAGKESLFRPALNDLDQHDRVGVAHWCDDGTAQIDLRPTNDRDVAIAALARTLQPIPFQPNSMSQLRHGELTLQKLVRLIIDDAHQTNPQPLPLLMFLHSDQTGMPLEELDPLVDQLLETSGTAYGIKDADVADFPHGMLGNGEQGSVLHYITDATGGQYFSIHPNLYATALQSVLLQLHFRYELGFKPPALDGKRHDLKVELIGAAKDQNKAARLRYRPEYIPGVQ